MLNSFKQLSIVVLVVAGCLMVSINYADATDATLPLNLNLLRNPNANQDLLFWRNIRDANIEHCSTGNKCFTVRHGGHFFQKVPLPNADGLFILLIGMVSGERINPNDSITGLPFLQAYLLDKDETNRIN